MREIFPVVTHIPGTFIKCPAERDMLPATFLPGHAWTHSAIEALGPTNYKALPDYSRCEKYSLLLHIFQALS
jgi:hypothetical protein